MVVSRCKALGVGKSFVPEMGRQVLEPFLVQAAAQRKTGNIEEARETAQRVYAYAEYFVAHYPDNPASHLAMADAHSQIYKNAWHENDRPAVERSLKLALGEARQAMSLDPRNSHATKYEAELARRLQNLIAPN